MPGKMHNLLQCELKWKCGKKSLIWVGWDGSVSIMWMKEIHIRKGGPTRLDLASVMALGLLDARWHTIEEKKIESIRVEFALEGSLHSIRCHWFINAWCFFHVLLVNDLNKKLVSFSFPMTSIDLSGWVELKLSVWPTDILGQKKEVAAFGCLSQIYTIINRIWRWSLGQSCRISSTNLITSFKNPKLRL